MRSWENQNTVSKRATSGTLLYVTDLMSGSDEFLECACELAEINESNLELIHVVDLHPAPSTSDAETGIRHRLDMLALKLKHLKRTAALTLLFGSPEDVISKRAADIEAKLIVFAFDRSACAEAQRELVRRLLRKVSCPVVILPATVALSLAHEGSLRVSLLGGESPQGGSENGNRSHF